MMDSQDNDSKVKFYHLNIEDVFNKLNSSPDGISSDEAKVRLEKYGKNELESVKPRPKILRFFDQFHDLMVVILIIAAVVSGATAIMSGDSLVDSVVILLIVVINATLGFFQEMRADNAMEALSKIQSAVAKVKRDGKTWEIPASQVVPGDVILLEAGDKVPADSRIISEAMLKVNESALTGESVAVEKSTNALRLDIPLSERKNMVFAGTNVVNGRATAVVCETGMSTQVGIIADSLAMVKKEITPLEQKINGVGKVLTGIIVAIITIMLVIGVVQGKPLMDTFMLAISLAVAAIPEGLTAVITVIMSIGVSEMARKRAVVRKMSSVETLGDIEVICSDKTGTITRNQMQLIEVYQNNTLQSAEKLLEEKTISMLTATMALANDAERNHQKYLGDPTEVALYEHLERYFDVDKFRDSNLRVGEIPFDSERKMMTTVNKIGGELKDTLDGRGCDFVIFSKGSLDSILDKCTKIQKGNKIVALTAEGKHQIRMMEKQESEKAYRILGYAYKECARMPKIDANLEKDLVFLGFSAMKDSPRPEVSKAIAICKEAGIRPVMITGDSLDTATAIAEEVGILDNPAQAVIGAELDGKTTEELKEVVPKYAVYARVSPTNKIQIVETWQKLGKIVAMTGDGVNDAPALKAADVGVGMGISGTEVAKAEADMILMNDSFSTIVTAVKEGRRIFDNICGVLVYLLTGNLAEVAVVFAMTLVPGLGIFTPLQLLYINLITDSLPAIMLAFEPESSGIMRRPPRRNNSSFFTPFLTAKIEISSLLKIAAVMAILVFFGVTAAFFTLVLLEMAFAYSCRNLRRPIWEIGTHNRRLNLCMLGLVVLQAVVFFTPVREIFGLETMDLAQVAASLAVVGFSFLVDELSKKLTMKIPGADY